MKPVLFGHQSVGQNLLEGVQELGSAGLPVPTLLEPDALDRAPPGLALVSFRIGRNQDPASKLTHFSTVTRVAATRNAGAALFKFCYVDIDETTDVTALLGLYRRVMGDIQHACPHLVLGHVTVPLRFVSTGPLGRMRRLLGQYPVQVRRNAARARFNDMLRCAVPAGQLFDLAAVESRDCNGKSCTTPGPLGLVPVLAREYTTDGGHLNALGRRQAARVFVGFIEQLARLSSTSDASQRRMVS